MPDTEPVNELASWLGWQSAPRVESDWLFGPTFRYLPASSVSDEPAAPLCFQKVGSALKKVDPPILRIENVPLPLVAKEPWQLVAPSVTFSVSGWPELFVGPVTCTEDADLRLANALVVIWSALIPGSGLPGDPDPELHATVPARVAAPT